MDIVISYLYQFEVRLVHHMSKYEFLRNHFNDPISQKITVAGVIILILIIMYKIAFQIGVLFGWWDVVAKEYFVDRPVHCAHVYVHGYVKDAEGGVHDSTKLKYHIEFSPEEYHDEDPDLGTTVGFLRRKLYFLFKDSEIYEDLELKKTFGIQDVIILDRKGKIVHDDSKPLCLVGIETGDRIKAHFHV